MIAFVQGHRRRRHARLRRPRGRRGRPRAGLHPEHPGHAARSAPPATLPTSMVVREESLTLFGFLDDDEKPVFELLQTASGVGPKLAQAMLAVHTPDELRRAVAAEDVKTLTTVPGIGQKGAQRIILELKDRIGVPRGTGAAPARARGRRAEDAWRGQVHAGLVGLGWSAKEADRAVEAVAPDADAVDRRARRRRAAAGRPADAEQGMSRRRVRARRRPRRRTSRAGRARGRAEADGDERAVEAALRPRSLDEVIGQERVREQLSLVLEAARARERAPDHVLLSGPPGLGKTTLAMIIAAEMSSAAAADLRAGDHPRRRPGGDPVRAQRRRRALRRRDPPDVAARRGDALHGDGGLPGRRRHRQGPRRHRHPAGDPAVHAGRRHHPRRAAARAAARPVRVHRAPGVLRARRARPDRAPLRRPARRRRSPTRAPPRSPPARGARPGSPTGCCAGSATSPRCAPTAWSPSTSRTGRSTSTRSTSPGLDRLDRAVLDVLCRRFGGGPVGVSTLAVAVGEERETVEEVAEPFLVRCGLLARTPRGRVATPAAWQHLGLAAPAARPFGAAAAVRGRAGAVRRRRVTRTVTRAGPLRSARRCDAGYTRPSVETLGLCRARTPYLRCCLP